jgi:hypothetical protein
MRRFIKLSPLLLLSNMFFIFIFFSQIDLEHFLSLITCGSVENLKRYLLITKMSSNDADIRGEIPKILRGLFSLEHPIYMYVYQGGKNETPPVLQIFFKSIPGMKRIFS